MSKLSMAIAMRGAFACLMVNIVHVWSEQAQAGENRGSLRLGANTTPSKKFALQVVRKSNCPLFCRGLRCRTALYVTTKRSFEELANDGLEPITTNAAVCTNV